MIAIRWRNVLMFSGALDVNVWKDLEILGLITNIDLVDNANNVRLRNAAIGGNVNSETEWKPACKYLRMFFSC